MRIVASSFDSAHYDLCVGRCEFEAGDDLQRAEHEIALAKGADMDVVFVRVAAASREHELIQAMGFVPVDELVTLIRPAGLRLCARPVPEVTYHRSLVEQRDLAAVGRITAECMTRSHLHADSRLPVERTRELYAAWAINDISGRAQGVFVRREAGVLVGYIAILERADHVVLDLVAVDPAFQGRGFGGELLEACCGWIADTGRDARVGTQRDNPALRLYLRAGFEAVESHLTYHLWL